MLRNNFKIAWRSITKRKFYTALNITGLALGITCSLFIYLYSSYHLSFDTYHKEADLIYRLVYELHLDKTEYDKGSSFAMFNSLRRDFPQVSQAALSIAGQSYVVEVNRDPDLRFREEKNISFTTSDWFKLFTYQWLEGNPKLLEEPGTAVLTQKQARKYFGSTSPVNQELTIGGQQFKVVALLADSPYNTDLKTDLYLSFASFKALNPDLKDDYFNDWAYQMRDHSAFVRLESPNQKDAVEKELRRLADIHISPEAHKWYRFKLLPLREIHFDSHFGGAVQKSLLNTLAVIGILIIVIAAINYINLVIAQQTRRSVEIGTRRVLGSSVKQLFLQFMTESFITSLLAISLALLMVALLLPFANNYLFAEQPVQVLSYLRLSGFLAALLFLITLFTGIYPAIFLSRVNVLKALKNQAWNVSAGIGRKILVIFQNTVAQALIVCTLIIALQVHFLKNTDLGFNREFVITVPLGEVTESQKNSLGLALKNIPEVESFTFCDRTPSVPAVRGATVLFNNRPEWEKWPARFSIGDSAYVKTFGIKISAGRNLEAKKATPEFLINEKMASMLGAKTNADVIGKTLLAGDIKGVIVGVVKDYNVRNISAPIEPTVILEESENLRHNLAIKLSGKDVQNALKRIQQDYQSVFPDQVFSYQFLDEQIARLYNKESLLQKLILIASVIAIIISSLGLLGLISLTTSQRIKEIGIRKVLGASIPQLGFYYQKNLFGLLPLQS